mmetsp:Transcript_47727/g.79187  ORF Transcript_47727/g.79187 Transcript_47727/m.79187 type:complete len:279 (+) Transcript_47727:694-1530(+)
MWLPQQKLIIFVSVRSFIVQPTKFWIISRSITNRLLQACRMLFDKRSQVFNRGSLIIVNTFNIKCIHRRSVDDSFLRYRWTRLMMMHMRMCRCVLLLSGKHGLFLRQYLLFNLLQRRLLLELPLLCLDNLRDLLLLLHHRCHRNDFLCLLRRNLWLDLLVFLLQHLLLVPSVIIECKFTVQRFIVACRCHSMIFVIITCTTSVTRTRSVAIRAVVAVPLPMMLVTAMSIRSVLMMMTVVLSGSSVITALVVVVVVVSLFVLMVVVMVMLVIAVTSRRS